MSDRRYKKMYREAKTPEHLREAARKKWYVTMAALTPEQKAEYKARKAKYSREWRAKSPKERAARARQSDRYKNDPEYQAKVKAKGRESRLRKEYGITEEQYQRMLQEQAGRCYLCRRGPGGRGKLVIDHCHKTGQVRRLLCDGCNVAIGAIENIAQRCEDPVRLCAYLGMTKKPANPAFSEMLERMRQVNESKCHDYTVSDPFDNFREAAEIAGCSIDTVFRTLIGVKMARLTALLGTGKKPLNEPTDDSLLDLANYATLWASYHYSKRLSYDDRQLLSSKEVISCA